MRRVDQLHGIEGWPETIQASRDCSKAAEVDRATIKPLLALPPDATRATRGLEKTEDSTSRHKPESCGGLALVYWVDNQAAISLI